MGKQWKKFYIFILVWLCNWDKQHKPIQHLAQISNLNQFNIWPRIQYLEPKSDAKPRHKICSWPIPANVIEAQRTLISKHLEWIRECSKHMVLLPGALSQVYRDNCLCNGRELQFSVVISSPNGGNAIHLFAEFAWVKGPPCAKDWAGCCDIRMKWHSAFSRRVCKLVDEARLHTQNGICTVMEANPRHRRSKQEGVHKSAWGAREGSQRR